MWINCMYEVRALKKTQKSQKTTLHASRKYDQHWKGKEGDTRPILSQKHFFCGGRRQSPNNFSLSQSSAGTTLWLRHWLDLWHVSGGHMYMMFLMITTFADY